MKQIYAQPILYFICFSLVLTLLWGTILHLNEDDQSLSFVQETDRTVIVEAPDYNLILGQDGFSILVEDVPQLYMKFDNHCMNTFPKVINEQKDSSQSALVYEELYDGADLLIYDKGNGHAAYDLSLAPGADPATICMQLNGIAEADIDEDGELNIPVKGGIINHSAPYAYQEIDGERSEVKCQFKLDDGCLSFMLGEYDSQYALVIDPEISFIEKEDHPVAILDDFSAALASSPVFETLADNNDVSGTGSLSISRPGGTVTADFLLAGIIIEDNSSISAPMGWMQIEQANIGVKRYAIFWKLATASEPASYTFTFSGTPLSNGTILRYSGVNPANPINGSAVNAGNSTLATLPNVNVSTDNSLVIGISAIASLTGSLPMGYDVRATSGIGNGTTGTGFAMLILDTPQMSSGPTGTPTHEVYGDRTGTFGTDWSSHTIVLESIPDTPPGDADYVLDDDQDGETIETCSGIFADSGDTNGDYGDDEDYTVTFCSDEDNQISFTFEHFGLDSGDELEIYDGEDDGASSLGVFSGVGEANSPGVVTSSGTCLTFNFTSDGSGNSQGWEASISCTGTPDVSADAGSWSGYSGGSCGNASTIGGTVYEDINNNGTRDTRDAPIFDVTVTLFDDNGAVGSPTTTDANGEYSFGGLSDQVYRVEFTVPDDFTEGPFGSGSGTAVQFVEPGVCADLGLVDVVHYCGDTNPFFVIPCYVNGDPQDDENVMQTGIAGFEYTDSGNSPTSTYENYVTAGAVGTIWGTAYDGNTEKLYMAPFLKRHAGLGPDGIGAIYMHTDGAANTSAPVFYDFGAAAGVVESNAARFPGSGDGFGEEGPCGTCDNIDPNTFGQVGKVGFGDIEINPENTDLYVTNLNDRKVYKIALDNPAANSATPLPGMPWLDNSVCSNGVARPWALEFRRGKLYVGVVCDASLSSCEPGTPCSDLTAEIYSFDGTSWTNELSQSLDYYRQAYVTGSNYFVRWIDNWSTMAPYVSGVTDANFAQPIVSDIEFDDDNGLILGIGDRTSMQLGYQAPPPTGPSGSTVERNMVFGDVLRAGYDNSTGNFTIESNGSVGGLSTTNPNGSSGIGGKSFYWGDYWTGIGANRFQGSIGSLAILPGSGQIMTPLADAIDYYSNGIVWMSNTNGASLRRLEVYQGSPNGLEPNFAKSAGVGDLELFCERPTIEIGNIVWWDDNLNGLQDPSETGIEGVTIELWIDPNGSTAGNNPLDGSGVKVAETETDEFGRFIFSYDGNPNSPETENWLVGDRVLPSTAYQIRIPDWVNDAGLIAQRNGLGYTEHLLSPTQNQGMNGGERDNNAYDNPGNAASAVLTGLAGENDHSHDFAFGGLGGCDAPTVVPGANTPCGGETLDLTATVTGGQAPYTYSWAGPNSFTSTDQNPSIADVDASLAAGTYTLVVTDALECMETVSIDVAINNLTVVATGTDATCGVMDGSIELDITGEAPFTIDWSDDALDGTEDPTGLGGGLYSVTVTDADGCSATATASVNSVDAPTLTVNMLVDETCTGANGSIVVGIADGASASITWSGNAPSPVNTSTSSTLTGLSAGTYSVTVTNTVMSLSCSAFLSITIEDTPAPTLSFSQINETCSASNASIDLSPSGGAAPYTFDWSDDTLDGTEDPTGIAAGTYDVTVTDANSCQVIEQIMITNAAPPTLGTTPTDETCGNSNGSIALMVAGGAAPYTYEWSNGLTTEDISDLGAGTYTVTVTDDNGCSVQTSETVGAIDGPSLSVSETDATDCNSTDGSVSLSVQGGTPSYSFNWSNGDMSQNLINVAAGTYTVTVTDGNGCTANITAIVGNGTDPVLTLTVTDPMGCGETGSIDLSVSGGVGPFTFDWSNDGLGEIDDEEDISGLAAGIYTVIVIGSDGCSAQANASIREIRAPIVEPTFTNPSCGMTDGSITLAVSDPDGVEFGGATYTYTWEDIGVGTATRTSLAPGNYRVTVSNEIGCETAATFSLNTDIAPSITPNITSPTCSANNGEIMLSVSGGTPAYSYSWERDGTPLMDDGSTLSSQGNGRYDVTVTDDNGCIAATSIELTSSTPPSLSALATPTSCVADDGSIDLVISGVAPFTVDWGHIGGTDNDEDLSDLGIGTYNVTVTDNNGCQGTGAFTIGLFGLPTLSLNDPADECIEGTDMNFTATPAPAMGTTGVFSSSASSGFTDNNNGTADLDISEAGVGTYTVTYTYTDENGCEDSETVSVTVYGQDYGDLPDSYPVTQLDNGARHCIPPNPMIYLGNVPDAETDGTEDDDAGEISGGDGTDEDGITEPSMLFRGEEASFTVDVVTNTTAYVYGYIDWDGNGVFTGTGEVQSMSTASSGSITLSFDVPSTAMFNTDLGARFRIGSVEDEVDQATGLASDGEVEDYIVQVKGLDYGDLPDDNIANTPDYATDYADDGPRHGLAATPLVFIGTGVEQDDDGQASTDADGDAEEADVTLPTMLFRGEIAIFNMNVTNNSDSTAKVVAYFDWNGDGDFEEMGEMGSSDPIAAMSVDEAVAIAITVPLDAVTDSLVGARFRISTDTSTIMGSANGFAMDGEVEDYLINIKDLDFGDLPDDQVTDTPDYATDYDDDGPRHGLAATPLVFIGAGVEQDDDGQANTDADGDAEEADVTLPTMLFRGENATFNMNVTNNSDSTAKVVAYVDWNGDGDFEEMGEMGSSDPIAAMSVNEAVAITIPVPLDAVTDSLVGARFRVSTDTSTIMGSANGFAMDGEVEDYLINIKDLDFGDLPDDQIANTPDYVTDYADDGPRHGLTATPLVFIGAGVEQDDDGQASTDADGDVEEDDVTLPNMLFRGESATFNMNVTNNSDSTAKVVAYFDWNGDGDFEEMGEMGSSDPIAAMSVNEAVAITIPVPLDAVTDSLVGARFRVSTDTSTIMGSANGFAMDGEVEDYLINIKDLDFGDLPDDNIANTPDYATDYVDDGPRHGLAATPLVFIGTGVEQDDDGQANTDADGDVEEDDVTLPVMLFRGESATFNMNVTNNSDSTAKVVAYFDWNGDGDFEEMGEMGSSDPIAAMSVNEAVAITITVPLNAVTDSLVGARFRVSTDTSTIMGSANGFAMDGEVEDYLINIKDLDFGDLPDDNIANTPDYATDYADDGPRHGLAATPLVFIGTGVEQDDDGQASTDADGDVEEDDVTLPVMLFRGESATFNMNVTNNSDSTAKVVAYVDWNGDGDFEEMGEMGSSDPIAPMSADEAVTILITVPLDAVVDSLVGARIRVSTDTSTIMGSANGFAMDGEVEDYLISIKGVDYGDAPDPDYPTTAASDGARHGVPAIPTVYLGDTIDIEENGQPQGTANGDDNNGDDEDGIVFENLAGDMQMIVACEPTTIVVTASTGGFLNAWLDYNGNGSWEDAEEQLFTDQALSPGPNELSFTSPCMIASSPERFLRFRFSTTAGLSSTGFAMDGEVEDYTSPVKGLDFGDLPDSPYPTLYANDPARHITTSDSEMYLGLEVDEENEGPQSQMADGEGDDDDGIRLLTPLVPGYTACLEVTTHTPAATTAYLHAWVDFNGDGSLLDEGDQIISDRAFTNTDNGTPTEICFEVPETATFTGGMAYMRFRFGPEQGLNPTGISMNGEVEDYKFNLAKVGNLVWQDNNYDGIQGDAAEEPGLNGMEVILTWEGPDGDIGLTADNVTFTDSTSSLGGKDGIYYFCGLIDGEYSLVVNTDRFPTSQGEGTVTTDSDDEEGTQVLVTVSSLQMNEDGTSDMPGMINDFPDNQDDQSYDFGYAGLDFGDLPETFFTQMGQGPIHALNPNIFLGSCVDGELDGTPDSEANGDDGASSDVVFPEGADCSGDEDGILLLTSLVPGAEACIQVTSTLPVDDDGVLNAWIDFNGNDQFDEGEQLVFTKMNDVAITPASPEAILPMGAAQVSELCFNVPSSATFEGLETYMRFRLSPDGDLKSFGVNENGSYPSGEVEDYYQPLATLGNYVWLDVNENGIQDANEPPLSGITVRLYQCDSDTKGEEVGIAQITDETGYYEFIGLLPGEYCVAFDASTAYEPFENLPYVFSPQVDDGEVDSNPGEDGCTSSIVLTPREANPTIDAGVIVETCYPPFSLSVEECLEQGATISWKTINGDEDEGISDHCWKLAIAGAGPPHAEFGDLGILLDLLGAGISASLIELSICEGDPGVTVMETADPQVHMISYELSSELIQPGTAYWFAVAEICNDEPDLGNNSLWNFQRYFPITLTDEGAFPGTDEQTSYLWDDYEGYFHTKDLPFEIAVDVSLPTCPSYTEAYTPDGCLLVNITDGESCWGTYDIYIDEMLQAEGVTPADGPFEYCGYGVGTYDIRVLITNECVPIEREHSMSIAIPEGIDDEAPSITVTDYFAGSLIADNNISTLVDTSADLGEMMLPEGACSMKSYFVISGTDNCDNIICTSTAVTAIRIDGEETLDPGTQVQLYHLDGEVVTDQGVIEVEGCEWVLEINWAAGASTVEVCMDDAEQVGASEPACITITAMVEDNFDAQIIASPVNALIPACTGEAAYVFGVTIIDGCDQSINTDEVVLSGVTHELLSINPSGYLEYLLRFDEEGTGDLTISYTDVQGAIASATISYTVTEAAEDSAPQIIAAGRSFTALPCEDGAEVVIGVNVLDDCDEIDAKVSLSGDGSETLIAAPVVSNGTRAYFEFSGVLAADEYQFTYTYPGAEAVTVSIIVEQVDNQPALIDMPGNTTFSIPSCNDVVDATWSVEITDDCDEIIDLSEVCMTLGDEDCLDMAGEDIEILSNENGAALISIHRALTATNNGTQFEVSYTDGAGQTSTASSTISINATDGNDAIPPVIIYPTSAITKVLDPCGPNQEDIIFSVSAIDNCSGIVPVDVSADGSVSATAVSEGDSQKWTITYEARSEPYRINLSATDNNGNTSTRSVLISIIQAAVPAQNLSCNTRLSALVDEYCQFRITPDIALEGTFGCLSDEDIVIKVDGQDSPIAQGTGEHEFEIYIEGSFFCRGSIVLSDNIAPTIECPTTNKDFICNDINQLLGELEETGEPIVNDNCGATYSWTEEVLYGTNETCDDVRIKRVFTATDEAGLSSSCEQFIVVRKPTLAEVLPPIELLELRCDEVQVYNEDGLPAPIETGGYPYVVSYFGPENINNLYCNLAATYKDSDVAEFCDKSYKFTRTWTVLDWCDAPNTREFSQLIKVGDFESPTLSPPTVDNDWDGQEDILSFSTGPFDCTAAFEVPLPEVTDNCSDNFNVSIEVWAAGETLIRSIGNGESRFISGIPLGCHTFQYLVSDDCGNKATLSVPFMVVDKVEPIAICNDELNVSVNSIGLARVMATEIDEGSWDNCGEVSIAVRRLYNTDEFCNSTAATFSEWENYVDFTCCDIGNVVRIEMRVWDDANGDGIFGNTITVYDCAGQAFEYADNSNLCWLDVTVEDELAAYCIVPHDTVVNCDELPFDFDPSQTELFNDLFGEASYQDNCAGVTITEEAPTISLNDCGAGTILRTFSTTDITGTLSTNSCQQLVTISGQYNYEIRFPADAAADCGAPSPDTITYEELGCDLLAVSVTDETFSASGDECYKIFRTYGVINWCEYNGESPPVIVSRDEDCDGTPGDEAIWVLRRPNGMVYFDRNNDETDNIPVAYTKKNSCDGLTNPSGYWIDSYMDADATRDPITGQDDNGQTNDNIRNIDSRGYWQYTQVIKVYDTVDPVIQVEDFEIFASLDGEECEGEVVINFSIKDACTQEEGLQRVWLDAFIVDTDEDGNFTQAEFISDADVTAFVVAEAPNYAFVASLPQGRHALLIEAGDGCGNEAADLILFEVVDTKAPAPVCLNGLSIELMPTDPSHPDADGDGDEDNAAMAIWANDFIASPVYDCNGQGPDVDLNGNGLITAYSINLVGEEAHRDSTGIVFTCDNDETTIVEIHAWDEAGNHDYCETYVFVQDLMNRCSEADGAIAGYLETEEGQGIQEAEVRLSGAADQVFSTQEEGYYIFEALATSDYSITPHLDINPLNGVSTLDLILMTKHILGEQLLASPYKIIAADVNNSRSVTTLDIIETRRLILGLNEAFANNTSWRFIKKDYVFPNPLNPWAEDFPTISSINDLVGEVRVDFVGVKIADVNTSARANSLLNIDERTYGEFQFDIEDIEMLAGNSYRIEVSSNTIERVTGYQGTFTLGRGVQWQTIEYGLAQPEHFNTALAKEGLLPHSWHGEAQAGELLFTLVLEATENTRLSEQLGLSSRITPSEAYDLSGQTHDLALNFDSGTKRTVGFELYQNRPNPFKDETMISFYLPEDSEAKISVYDLSGKVLHSVQQDFKKGKNTVILTDQELVSTGTLFYTVTAGAHTANKKMIRLD